MNTQAFLIDAGDRRLSYEQLESDIRACDPPEILQEADPYDLFVSLFAALRKQRPIALVPLLESYEDAVAAIDACPPFLATEREGGLVGIFTSGTTGRPKLIWHSKNTLTRLVKTSAQHRNDCWGLCYSPTSFAGVQVLFQAYENRNPLVRLFGQPVDQVHEAIETHSITHLSCTPTYARLLCGDRRIHENVRSFTLGGEVASSDVLERVAEFFPNAKLNNIYASTEVGSLFISHGEYFEVPSKLQDKVRVRNDELQIHSSLLASSLQDANNTKAFFATGDIVKVYSEVPLRFAIVGRNSDWINVGGLKVNPAFVESQVRLVEGVLDAHVYGRSNSVTGNIVCADVVANTSDAGALKAALRSVLARHEVPQIIRFVPELATNDTGKTTRVASPTPLSTSK